MKFKYKKLEDIPEALRSFYSQNTDGDYVLQCEGAVAKDALDDFRNNNTKLLKENGELKAAAAKFEGIDPDEHKKLKNTKELLDAGKLIEAGKVDEALAQRTAAMKTDFDTKLKAAEDKANAATAKMGVLTIDNALVAEGTKLGLLPSAIPDYVNRGRAIYKLDPVTNEPVPYEADGVTVKCNVEGKPMKIGEWAATTAKLPEYAHLFGQSGGGGAPGGGGVRGAGINPFTPGKENFTEMARIMRENPTQAKELQTQAGATMPGMA